MLLGCITANKNAQSMTALISPLIDWLNAHPQLIAATLAAMAFIESLAMIGVIVPGVALLFATAALAGSLQTPLYLCLLAAMCGAIGGDLCSFFLGRHAHRRVLQAWPFKQHPEWVSSGERFFRKYGIYSVVIGRFVGPIRPVLPFVAGMLSMPSRRFILVNFGSALLWAPVYILPGYWLGGSAQQWSDSGFIQRSELLGTALGSATLLALILLYLAHRWMEPSSQFFLHLSARLKLTPPSSQPPPATPAPRHHAPPLAFLLLAAASLLALLALTLVVSQTHWLAPLNAASSQLLFSLRNPAADNAVILFTLLGDGPCLLALSLVIWCCYWRQGQRAIVAYWAGALLVAVVINQGLKWGLAIPRPQWLAQPLDSYAFPSAHSSLSSLFFTLLAAFSAQSLPYRRRWLVYGPAALAVIAMAFSRLYLGVHWLSDVTAGILLGVMVAALTQLLYQHRQHPKARVPAHPWRWALLAAAVATAYLAWNLDTAISHYQAAAIP